MDLNAIRTLDHTVLLCTDLDATKAFYRDILRLPIEVDRERWVSFRVGGTLLTIRPRCAWDVCDDGPIPSGSTPVQLGFRVPPPAIDHWHAILAEHDVEILRPPTELPVWRHRTLFFRDPEHNIVELYAEY